MHTTIRVALVCLVLTAAASAQAQVNIIPDVGGLGVNASVNTLGGVTDSSVPPTALNTSVIQGTIAPGQSHGVAAISSSISSSAISGSGLATAVTGDSGLWAAANSFLNVDFEAVFETQLVLNYSISVPTVPASYLSRVATVSLWDYGLDDYVIIDQISSTDGASSQSVVMMLQPGTYSLVGQAGANSGNSPTGPVAPLTWELDAQLNTGQTQNNPLLPNGTGPGGGWLFNGAPGGGLWFDPVLAHGFEFEMLSGADFTVAGMPVGLGDADGYTLVYMDGLSEVVVPLDEGDTYNFPAGVDYFKVLGIDPHFDPEDPLAFPIFLDFSTPFADFTMTPIPVPEPGSLVLLALGALFLPAWRRHRMSRIRPDLPTPSCP